MVEGTVFISYVREDEVKVRRLAQDLQEAGIEVWLDRKDLQPGTNWKRSIRHAIQHGTFFIACFSEAYTQRSSTYMNEELLVAVDVLRQKPMDVAWLVPVKLSAVEIPDYDISPTTTLRDLQFVDLFSNWRSSIDSLVAVIKPNRQRLAELAELTADGSKAALWAIEKISTISDADAVDLLIKVGRETEEGKTLVAVIKALGDTGHESAAFGVIEVISRPFTWDFAIRVVTPDLLDEAWQKLEASKNVRPLVIAAAQQALQHKNKAIRLASISTLMRTRVKGLAEVLTTQYVKEEDTTVRRTLVDAFYRLKDEASVKQLFAIVSDSRASTTEAILAIRALGKLRRTEAITLFVSAVPRLRDGDPQMADRSEAMIEALGFIGDPNVVPFLDEQLVRLVEGRLRLSPAALAALRRIRTPEAKAAAATWENRIGQAVHEISHGDY